MHYIHEWIGITAAILSVVALIPLLMHVIKTKSTDGLNYYWLIITIIASILWLIYSISNGIVPNIINRLALLVIIIIILILKISYENRKKVKTDNKSKTLTQIQQLNE